MDMVVELALMGASPPDSMPALLARYRQKGLSSRGFLGPEVAFPWWSAKGDSVSLLVVMRRGDSLARAASRAPATVYGQFLGDAARAHLALIRHDTTSAISAFLALPDTLCNACDFDRLTLARLLLARGRAREAADILDAHLHDRAVPLLGFWTMERARLHEALGARDRAAQEYAQVAAMWQHADASLQPVVARATAARDRLRGAATR
jgi:hypothetical protein